MIFTDRPNINIPNFGGPQNTGQNQHSTTQRIQIVEALCEGPVWGLTEGSASVYFNNTRAIEPEDATFSLLETLEKMTQTLFLLKEKLLSTVVLIVVVLVQMLRKMLLVLMMKKVDVLYLLYILV